MCTSGVTADVAQSGERKTEDLKVASSILAMLGAYVCPIYHMGVLVLFGFL